MDLLTQGLLGANLAVAGAASRDNLRKTALVGLLAGLAADVDFLIRSADDPLLNLEFHRHFTHSLLFVPLAALILSALLWPLLRNHFRWRRLLLICFLGYLPSGFLDAATSYGTSLLWPVSDTRFSFNVISIIDPLFTLLLLAGLVLAMVGRKRIYLAICLGLAAAYLLMGWVQQSRVEDMTRDLARQRGHDVERLLVRPTLGNLVQWRSLYLHAGHYHVDAVRMNPLTGTGRVFTGSSVARFDPASSDLPVAPASVLGRDIRRFQRFTNDYLAFDPARPGLLSDVRYANLPTSTAPLWAIRIDPSRPQEHAAYELFRDSSQATRQAFMNMLLGGDD